MGYVKWITHLSWTYFANHFRTKKQTPLEDLFFIYTWRTERDSNPRPSA